MGGQAARAAGGAELPPSVPELRRRFDASGPRRCGIGETSRFYLSAQRRDDGSMKAFRATEATVHGRSNGRSRQSRKAAAAGDPRPREAPGRSSWQTRESGSVSLARLTEFTVMILSSIYVACARFSSGRFPGRRRPAFRGRSGPAITLCSVASGSFFIACWWRAMRAGQRRRSSTGWRRPGDGAGHGRWPGT